MSFANYRAEIAALAAAEADGEGIGSRIGFLAVRSGVTVPMIRHEITEHAEL